MKRIDVRNLLTSHSLLQDRMFKVDGTLFYPAFEGDPGWEDFIAGEGAELPEEQFPNGGATALAVSLRGRSQLVILCDSID